MSASLALPVAAYLADVRAVCESAHGQIVSLVLFGSAATGGYAEQSSDVDLLIVVRDDVDRALRGLLRDQVAELEVVHGLARSEQYGGATRDGTFAAALAAFAARVIANTRAFFLCTRADLLSGDPARILDITRRQAQFVDRVAIPSIAASGYTIWGEPLLNRISLPPIRRKDVAKSFFGLFNQVLFAATLYPYLPSATKFAMDALKRSVHNCYFCHQLCAAPLATEVAFFEKRYGPDRTLQRLLVLRARYRASFGFVVRCFATLVRLHGRTALHLRFPRAARSETV